MFIYQVTIGIKKDVANEWVKWMEQTHLQDVMNTGSFLSHKFYKIIIPSGMSDEVNYVVQYKFSELKEYEFYQRNYAAKLQKEHSDKFKGKFHAARAVFEEINEQY